MIIFLTYVIAALIVGSYIAWFVYRYRRDQRNKAMEAERQMPSTTGLLGRDPMDPSPPPLPPRPDAPAASMTPSTSEPTPTGGTEAGARTVAEALSGIEMPQDLVPFTTMPARPGVVDQVAFSSHAPVTVIGPLFADELERLGYVISPLDESSLAAKRGNDNLVVYIHPEPPVPAPEGIVVIETCVPY